MKKALLLLLLIVTISANAQWTNLNSGTTNQIINVSAPTVNDVFYSDGFLHKSANGGQSFTLVNNYQVDKIYFINATTGFTLTANGIEKTTDAGINWLTVAPLNNLLGFSSIHFPTSSIGYATAFSGIDTTRIYKTTDGGNTWFYLNRIAINNFVLPEATLFFTDANTGHLTTSAGEIWKTINGGTAWTLTMPNTLAHPIAEIFFPSADTGYAVNSQGHIFSTHNGGQSWFNLNSSTTINNTLFAVRFVNNNHGFVVGGINNLGYIFETNDAGVTWTVAVTTSPQQYTSLCFSTATIGYASSGTNGEIKKYDASLGINHHETNPLNIFPNPSSGIFTLQKLTNEQAQVIVYDMLGSVILTSKISSITSTIDLTGQAKGIYFVTLTEGEKMYSQKVVVD